MAGRKLCQDIPRHSARDQQVSRHFFSCSCGYLANDLRKRHATSHQSSMYPGFLFLIPFAHHKLQSREALILPNDVALLSLSQFYLPQADTIANEAGGSELSASSRKYERTSHSR